MAEEARAEHVIGAPAGDRPEHPLEVGRVIFAIAVEVDGGGVALVPRDAEPGAKSGPEAAAGRLRMHAGPLPACDLGGAVARAVVDEQHVHRKPARLARQPRKNTPDRSLLVASNDNGKAPKGGLRQLRAGPRPRFHRSCPA
jgi:hypothetical protein